MKFGTKIWSKNKESFPKILELYKKAILDFVEIYIVPGSDPKEADILKNLPIIFHAPNFHHKFNVRKQDQVFKNSLKTIKRFSEYFNEKRIVVHPGISKTEEKLEDSIPGIKKIKEAGMDILIENMPKIGIDEKKTLYGSTREEIKSIMTEIDCNFCLDVGHAICSANFHKKDPIEFINEFIRLKPIEVHISDGDFDSIIDQHKSIEEGNYPFDEIIPFIKNIEYITIETDKKDDYINLEEDKKNLIKLKQLFSKYRLYKSCFFF
ncbi:MAG: sugar phosphate isomerase/epimerase family protein [Candidatus Woesearchaeota archaeon]